MSILVNKKEDSINSEEMKEYLVCEWALSYGIFLNKARRFKEKEKADKADWFKDYGFVSLGYSVKLNNVNTKDLERIIGRPLNEPDGAFMGCSSQVYIIDQESWDNLMTLDTEKAKEKAEKTRLENIQYYKDIIYRCESQSNLYTKEEAKRARTNYNNLYNEGGEGYVSLFYTIDEYKYAKRRLEELQLML